MPISSQEVVKLRQITGAGMMDCKKALTESEGNVDKAIEVLRKRGQKLSQARADRSTSEGCVLIRISSDKTEGMLLTLACETDFVAKNEEFNILAEKVAETAFEERPAEVADLLALSRDGLSIEEHLNGLIAKIGEKITISNYLCLKGDYLVGYLHTGDKLGVLVALSGAEAATCEEVGKNIAMQIAAMNPLALDKSSISEEIIQKELEIGKELARKEGKSEEILEKIAQGRLQKFFKEQTLLQQSYVKDSSLSVEKYVHSVAANLQVKAFLRVSTVD